MKEGPGLQAEGTIKQHVVEDDVLVEQPDACTNDCLAIVCRIPSDAQLWSKIRVGFVDPISPAGKLSIDCSISRQIAVGSAGIVVVPNAVAESEVGLDLPSIAHVEAEAMIGTKPASRKSQSGLLGVEAQTIAIENSLGWPIQRIG